MEKARKETIITYNTVHNKLMVEQHEPPLNIRGEHRRTRLVSNAFPTKRSRGVIFVRQNPATDHGSG